MFEEKTILHLTRLIHAGEGPVVYNCSGLHGDADVVTSVTLV